jgi:hypothetical protein
MAVSLRQSAGLMVGDLVILAPYPSHIEEAKEVRLQNEDNADASTGGESLSFFLREELCIILMLLSLLSATTKIPLCWHEV